MRILIYLIGIVMIATLLGFNSINEDPNEYYEILPNTNKTLRIPGFNLNILEECNIVSSIDSTYFVKKIYHGRLLNTECIIVVEYDNYWDLIHRLGGVSVVPDITKFYSLWSLDSLSRKYTFSFKDNIDSIYAGWKDIRGWVHKCESPEVQYDTSRHSVYIFREKSNELYSYHSCEIDNIVLFIYFYASGVNKKEKDDFIKLFNDITIE